MAKIISKLLLFVFNVVYLAAALAILVIGSMSLAGDEIILDMLDLIEDTSLVASIMDWKALTLPAAIYFVTLGSVAVLLSFIGCFGAFKDNRIILIFFGFAKLCIVLFNLALIMYNAIVPYHGQEHMTDLMKDNLKANFEPIVFSDTGAIVLPEENSTAWHWAKMEFEQACCAANNYTDYVAVLEEMEGKAENVTWTENAVVSATCCMQVNQYRIPTSEADFVNVTTCITSPTSYVNYRGCSDYVMSIILSYRQVYMITAAAFVALEVIVIGLTIHVSDKKSSVGAI